MFFLKVRLGSHDVKSRSYGVQTIRIEKITLHPNFKKRQVYNDIAIIKLSLPARRTLKVQPICLNPIARNNILPVLRKSTVTVIGYGSVGSLQPTSEVLLKSPPLV